MVWGNFFGRNLLDFGGVQTLAQMVWGTFFGDKVPQSARLSAGRGGAKAIRAMPKCLQHEFEWGFPYVELRNY